MEHQRDDARDKVAVVLWTVGASRLAQHSMRLVDGESCFASCADKMAALGVAKDASTDDVDEGVKKIR